MKVLQIGDNVRFGHRFNGHDLGKYLRDRGIASEHLVWWKNRADLFTHEISGYFQGRQAKRDEIAQLNTRYSSNALFYPFSYYLLFNPIYLDSDVVHLHLIHNSFFGIEHLPIISRLKPVVWTLHDPWAITGHCHYPITCERWLIGCGDCPDLKRPFDIQDDTTALNWEYKRIIFKSCDLDIIVASQWMYEQVSKSSFFSQANIHLLNFGIDLSQFKPVYDNAALKKKFGIPVGNTVIAFRSTSSIYKGLEYVKGCLKDLSAKTPVTLLTFNEKGLLKDFSLKFQIIELGWIDDDQDMIDAYNAADIFLMPSVAEAFGMMAMEAMACGKPVIVMGNTALEEVIRPEESGCIVIPQGDVNAMRIQMEGLIESVDLRRSIGERSRSVAEKYYFADRYVSEIITVYEKAIQRKNGNVRGKYIVAQQKFIDLSIENGVLATEKKADISGMIVSDIEYNFLLLIRRLRQIALFDFCYRYIAKPFYNLMRNTKRLLKPK